jgi:hypothetical protein
MWYMPYLRVRHAVLVYVLIAVGITLVAIALRFWPGSTHFDGHETSVRVGLSMIVMAATALVGGFATVLGLNLAAENEGHLELAWTKPVSRERYALGVFAVDVAAMAACIVVTCLCLAVVVDVFAGGQAVTLGGGADALRALGFLGFPLSVYAWITALSASLKRNRGTVAGLFWPLMLVLSILTLLPIPAVHAVVGALNRLNPIAVFLAGSSSSQSAGVSATITGLPASVTSYAWGWVVAALLLAAALLQWRRLEV